MKPSNHPTILLIDNDAEARRVLWNRLSDADYGLLEAATAAKGLALVRSFKPTLVLIDIDLPDMEGIELVRAIHVEKESIIVVVSALSNLNFVIAALDAGADDFVPKPFSIGELEARVRVALRHAAIARKNARLTFRAGELEVDFGHRTVQVSGRTVHLTPLEYRILSLLIDNADRVLTYDRLLRELWESQKGRQLQNIRVLMANLRRKLELDPARPRHLVTATGQGYQFQTGG
jgi:two-component system, OmpR family, KDP operon response regulator KdpE